MLRCRMTQFEQLVLKSRLPFVEQEAHLFFMGRPQYVWNAPPAGTMRDYTLQESSYQEFLKLVDFRLATGQELHGFELDYDVFLNVRPPGPSRPHAVYESRDMDFRLRLGSAAVDAGCQLNNVNDDFTGSAPDLGAYEAGRPIPVYGPRQQWRQAWLSSGGYAD